MEQLSHRAQPTRYTDVENSPGEGEAVRKASQKPYQPSMRRRVSSGLGLLIAFICGVFVTAAITVAQSFHFTKFLSNTTTQKLHVPNVPTSSTTHPDAHTTCGVNITTAIANNCTFSAMSNNWVPSLCDTYAMLESTLSPDNPFGAFTWYTDLNLTRPVSDLREHLIQRSLSSEPAIAYTTEYWHLAHCSYMMRVGLAAAKRVADGERNVWVHSKAIDQEHLAHCAKITAAHGRCERRGAVAEVKFVPGRCVKVA